MTDAQLLTEFRQTRSPQAFSTLVDRHIGWIYTTARRQVRDEHLAHDVAQAVLLLLSERADQIRDPDRLAAWLLQTTLFASNHAIREESRRRKRERVVATARAEAVVAEDPSSITQQVSLVDEAMGKMKKDDRSLITIRFYQGRSLSDLGAELGISPDAARKRLDRAIQRLRHRLSGDAFPDSLGAALAAITSASSTGITTSFNTNTRATSRAISISKGVSHMLLRNRIKQATALTCITLALGAGAVLAFQNSGSEGDPHASAPRSISTPATQHRSVETYQGAIIISEDGTKLTGYSMLTGKWAQIEGKGFVYDRIIAGGNVLVYHADDRCYAFSPTLGIWDSIALPHPLDPQLVIGPGVSNTMAGVAVPGFVYAYTPTTGKWESLATPGDKPAPFTVSLSSMNAEVGGKIYYCDPTTGKWTPGF